MKEGYVILSYNYFLKMIEIFKIVFIFFVDNEGNNDICYFFYWVCCLFCFCIGGIG